LADFPAVVARRIDAEAHADSAWHGIGRALAAQGVPVPTQIPTAIELVEFGGTAIILDGEEVRPILAKCYELLGFLAARNGAPASRDELLNALFDARDDESARSYLRKTIIGVRRLLPPDVLSVSADGRVALSPDIVLASESVRLEQQLAAAARLQRSELVTAPSCRCDRSQWAAESSQHGVGIHRCAAVHHDPYDVTRVWIRNHRDGGWITAFWRQRQSTVRVADGEPGAELQVDFGGLGMLTDAEDGRRRMVQGLVFTAVYCRHIFVWPTYRQTLGDVIAGFEAAWVFFGGVFAVVIPDNMKPPPSTNGHHQQPRTPGDPDHDGRPAAGPIGHGPAAIGGLRTRRRGRVVPTAPEADRHPTTRTRRHLGRRGGRLLVKNQLPMTIPAGIHASHQRDVGCLAITLRRDLVEQGGAAFGESNDPRFRDVMSLPRLLAANRGQECVSVDDHPRYHHQRIIGEPLFKVVRRTSG
jgi:hypothetical protein